MYRAVTASGDQI